MRFRVDLAACALAGLAALGCRKGSTESTEAEPPGEQPPSSASAREAPAPAPTVLTVEDFEEEAARQITAESIDSELDLLEPEIRKKRPLAPLPDPSAARP